MIATYVGEAHENWDEHLALFAYAIRSSVHESTGVTPAELFLGRRILTPFEVLTGLTDEAAQRPTPARIKELAKMAQDGLRKAHLQQARNFNKNRRVSELQVNDLVLLETHFQSSASNVFIKKFAPLYEGPFRIIKTSHNNVTLKKRDGTELYAHVQQVKKYVQRNVAHIVNPSLSSELSPSAAPEPVSPPPFTHDRSISHLPSTSAVVSSQAIVSPIPASDYGGEVQPDTSTEPRRPDISPNQSVCPADFVRPGRRPRSITSSTSSSVRPPLKKTRHHLHPPGFRPWQLRSGVEEPRLPSFYARSKATRSRAVPSTACSTTTQTSIPSLRPGHDRAGTSMANTMPDLQLPASEPSHSTHRSNDPPPDEIPPALTAELRPLPQRSRVYFRRPRKRPHSISSDSTGSARRHRRKRV